MPHNAPPHRRRGAALALVLVALVLVAALGAGATLASREARRAARDDLARVRAESRAAGSLDAAVRHWDPRWSQLPLGASDSALGTADPADTVRVLRLDRTRFLVEATARARAAAPGTAGWAARTASAIVVLEPPSVTALAALTAGGPVALLDRAAIDGRDLPPPGWTDCQAPATDSAAVATPGAHDVSVAPQAIVSGALKQQFAAADTTTYSAFGRERWSSLAARADVVVDGAAGPYTPTSQPLVVVNGNVTMQGPASVRGVWLVNGDLTLDGIVTIAGVVVVRGALQSSNGALRLNGALLLEQGGVLSAGSLVQFSRCATERALDGAAIARAARRRSWAEVTR